MDLKELGINTRNWVDSAQDKDYWRALGNAALNLRVPYTMELVMVGEYRKIYLLRLVSRSWNPFTGKVNFKSHVLSVYMGTCIDFQRNKHPGILGNLII